MLSGIGNVEYVGFSSESGRKGKLIAGKGKRHGIRSAVIQDIEAPSL